MRDETRSTVRGTEVADVSVVLGGRTVLDGVSLKLSPGSVTVVHGGNGSGKSTLLAVAAGLLRPTRGRVTSRGVVAYLPERFRPPGAMSADSYLTWVARARGLSRAGAAVEVAALCSRLDLRGATGGAMRDLSKGNLQKVGLAQVLLGRPDLLVMDEPISGLDLPASSAVSALVAEAADRGARVLVAHHGSDVFAGSTSLSLADGRLTAGSTPAPPPTGFAVRAVPSVVGAPLPGTLASVLVEWSDGEARLWVPEAELAGAVRVLLAAGWRVTGVDTGESTW